MAEPVRLGVVCSEFNYDITHIMLQKALEHASFLAATVTYVVKTPGSFDVPIAVQSLLAKDDVDAVVALGAIVQGATKHDELIAQHCARKMMDLSIQHGKPATLGISGPGMNRVQALERAEEYARRAVEASVKLVRRLRALREARFQRETVRIE